MKLEAYIKLPSMLTSLLKSGVSWVLKIGPTEEADSQDAQACKRACTRIPLRVREIDPTVRPEMPKSQKLQLSIIRILSLSSQKLSTLKSLSSPP